MSKLPVVTGQRLIKALHKIGFEVIRRKGSTIEDAVANLKEATELYLEEFPIQDFPKSLMTTFEAAVNA
jgi:predicted Fe-Mo cluster-binding NifX family protein